MDTQKFPYLTVAKNSNKVIGNGKNIGVIMKADNSLSNYKQINIPEDQSKSIFETTDHNIIDLSVFDNIVELSEVIKDLDLLISIESDVVHLAGSLNIPTWVLLPVVPKHTWDLSYKDTTPWYPSVRLFRQESRDDWTGVIKEVKERLNSV